MKQHRDHAMVKEQNQSKAPGEFGNQGPEPPSRRARKVDREERLQRTKDQAPSDQGGALRTERAAAQGREDLPEGLAPGEPKATTARKGDPGIPRTSHSEPTRKDRRAKS
jgi:hypothetical protein